MPFQPWTCYRCEGTFKTIRLWRRHVCPANPGSASTALDRAQSRYRRKKDEIYRRTGRRSDGRMI